MDPIWRTIIASDVVVVDVVFVVLDDGKVEAGETEENIFSTFTIILSSQKSQ